MKKTIALLSLFFAAQLAAQNYQPTWESLDKRPTPSWFTDAKFGIFIHWGVYSVPGWSSKGQYAEWYQQGLQGNDTARQKFHKAKFGDRTYYDLARDFKAELFNPDEWAKVFEQSGAKYIVLTSKHHDGFTLWPSAVSDRDWGFKWNAVDVGPKRDLINDLFKAVRKTSVHAGMYYSLYEWFNPLWKADKGKFATEHTWPQMKELINNYQPDVFWTDGDWEASDSVWKSKEFLTWLYNESPVKNKIIVNDRWGAGLRFKHGGIYTPEYQPDLDFEDHAWEESRGMGYSYGYNREEDAWDYNSTQSLVLQLIDKVSRGGNFLLDIGPDEHGKIPPIMQERLLQMGEWLKTNGEAIYNTTRWKIHSQWSEGNREYKDRSGDMLLKITVDPDPGYAVKELFYTYNANNNSLYAIFPKYPDNKKLVLKDITLPAGTAISFLSTKENVSWKQNGNNVEIILPDYNPNKIKLPYAYAIKIENFGRYTNKPKVNVSYDAALKPTASIENITPGAVIHYTTDGTMPTVTSAVYTRPLVFKNTTTLKTIAIKDGLINSDVQETNIKAYELMKAGKPAKSVAGLNYSYFEAEDMSAGKMQQMQPSATGVANKFSLDNKKRKSKFGFIFTGYINIAKTGLHDFFVSSDDGSLLYIDDVLVVDNNGDHGMEEKSGKAVLEKGLHKIKLIYFDSAGDNGLNVSFNLNGQNKMEVPAGILFH
ncbi:alpha-L-fucosidase [Ferruginibacter sp. SUN106]|uniref:alpha-L-fucosidase n=1 Tax=Ferruginibacter sp. SUN106 TaxID=2978348 RepID=UPI003D36159E